jgi:hypothetical protein
MPKFDFYPSFNAGEVSPFIDARTSLEKYRSACRTLENFQILPYGGVIRRPGTEFRGPPKNPAAGEVRLIGFNFSTTTRFLIEMGVGYLRFWSGATGLPVTVATPGAWATGNIYSVGNYVREANVTYYCTSAHTSGTFATDLAASRWVAQTILEVPTPYAASALREIQFSQINDLMYFAHANYPPRKLSRLADNNWTFEVVDWDFPPQLDENTEATTISTNGELGTVTLTSPSAIFKSGHVSTKWNLKWKRLATFIELNFGGTWASVSMDTQGAWDFTTFGTWNATIRILRTPYETWKNGPITCSVARATTVCTVTHNNHGYAIGDSVHFVSGPAPFYSATPYTILSTGFTANSYQVTVANSGATSGSVVVENITNMEIVKEYDSNSDRNVVASGTETLRCGLKMLITSYTAPSVAPTLTPRALLQNSNNYTGGTVKINSVAANGLTASASVMEWLGAESRNSKPTIFWAEPAFSGERGYPRAVAMHEQRLIFGGTTYQPNAVWGSAIDDFENFQKGTTASDAFGFTLAASEGNRINWMYSQSQLLIGTSGDEWTIGSADSSQALSATNVQANRQSSYGSKYMRAALVNDVLLFIQRNGRKVRELVYELNKDGWVAPDLTLLAEHITSGEIVEIAYQQQPDAILWCVRGDGTLIAMTYERDQKVVGWHRHVIGDDADVESVATIYGNQTEDEVWMVVKRTVSGQTYRTIERFPLLWRKYLDDQTAASWRYLDGHVAFVSGAAGRTISGLDRFNGKTVTVMQDGQSPVTRTVASGAITVPSGAAGYVGLPYTSTLTPMKLDMDLEDGSSQGRKKRIHKIIARLYKSRGGEIRTNNGEWYALADTVSTGDQKMILAGAFGLDADVTLRQTAPYPMAVIALQPVWDTFGNE